jgi:translocation protein SEC63
MPVLMPSSHPDKVRLTGNMTAETVAAKFVEITKAYKSYVLAHHIENVANDNLRLTDEVTRENWLKYNNPDGPQQTEMGIALPPWVVEAQNNKWILGIYGLIFGVALPAMVGRWWFGSQAQTKDGVQADTASNYFRALTEDSEISEVVGALAQAAEWDTKSKAATAVSQRQQHLDALEAQIEKQVGPRWTDIRRLADASGKNHAGRRQALVLLYAHLLRLPVEDSSLEKGDMWPQSQ